MSPAISDEKQPPRFRFSLCVFFSHDRDWKNQRPYDPGGVPEGQKISQRAPGHSMAIHVPSKRHLCVPQLNFSLISKEDNSDL